MKALMTLMGILKGVPSRNGSVFFSRSIRPLLSVLMYSGILDGAESQAGSGEFVATGDEVFGAGVRITE
jgi:hypothetical protein